MGDPSDLSETHFYCARLTSGCAESATIAALPLENVLAVLHCMGIEHATAGADTAMSA